MADGWVDERVRPGAEASVDSIVLRPEGVRILSVGQEIRADWAQVLGVTVLGPRLYLLLPRRPPHPPWVELGPDALPADLPSLERLAEDIARRLSSRGYRDAPPEAGRPPEALLHAVLAREAIPGALEIPVGPGPSSAGSTLAELTGGAVLSSAMAGLSLALTHGSLLMAGLVGSVSFGSVVGAMRRRRSPDPNLGRKRVLVLAPEGCVVGLPSGVRAFGWDDIGRFATGPGEPRDAAGAPETTHLWLFPATEGAEPARLHRDWFTRPVSLIVEVAEAYRRRHARR